MPQASLSAFTSYYHVSTLSGLSSIANQTVRPISAESVLEALGSVKTPGGWLTPPYGWSVDSGTLTTPDTSPLSGNAQLTLDPTGETQFTSHAHDAGFTDIGYTIVCVYLTTDGWAFLYTRAGYLHGTDSIGSRDDNYGPFSASNAAVAKHFDGVGGGVWHCSIFDDYDYISADEPGELGWQSIIQSAQQSLGLGAVAGVVPMVWSKDHPIISI
jgi:hypothetical protein